MYDDAVFLGLGSNLGDRHENLRQALAAISLIPKTDIIQTSSVYETEPVGYRDQPEFYNMVCHVRTDQTPAEFLRHSQRIERELGRKRRSRWGPRTIDIDILFWGTRRIATRDLKVPHPQALKRRFVMQPLSEIAPEYQPPGSSKVVVQLAQNCPDKSKVVKITSADISFT